MDQIVGDPPVGARRPVFQSGALWALARVARYHRRAADPAVLAHELAVGRRPAAGRDIVRGARLLGLRARVLNGQTAARLEAAPRPLVIGLRNGRYGVLRRIRGEDALALPGGGGPKRIGSAALAEIWSGEMILIAPEREPLEPGDRVDWRWFGGTVWRYRRPLAQVLVASLFVQLFALVTPLFFQIIIDKVLVHKAYDTLMLVGGALVVINVFDVLLQWLRSYVLTHTSSRIDVELGSQLYRKLLRLPLGYFEQRPTGQTVARVREIENIRSFLTGQGLTSLIDCLFTIIFLAVLFLYSVKLGIIVTVMVPAYMLVVMLIRPWLRRRVNERFNRSAESQQFLVESIVGAATLKAAAVEPFAAQQWEERLALYVGAAFRTQMLGTTGQMLIQYLTKLSTVLILFFGAQEVIEGRLTVGGLIAFNMIANQMTAPVLRLANLWQDFQQVQVSVERLGDILNTPAEPEGGTAGQTPPPLKGAIAFRGVTFRYAPETKPVLRDIDLAIAPGEVIGVVGPSGSGKSTLAKLIQRLYLPEAGQIRLDGRPAEDVHTAWLRRQIGVVLQENLLFNRTVHENIALAAPKMPRAKVIAMARLAGADEFIRALPEGYDTRIVERGANLSGGQRQRLAIARALARDPRILIFDEATSALDFETEAIIQANMKQIVAGRTVIIVAHRLAAVRDCDRIIGLRDGRIVESGSHAELLAAGGLYAGLWALQVQGAAA
ncbi:peptidase domain-containing ABC transporter [Sphingomonas morindae]|uniref:Type I secretion system permease/ATPase n=1 Tax=Sphingomonas morindae TaxID=1541170 RepID=A0ABY4X791_9SPHN|nr:type I secretion system permease/ATPase [Sphingomonas morindae]USI72798.1 type I secretion system permease/ATPase [Sphingomonas morindae]